MKISIVGHASILVDAGDVRVLSDPWWQGPCFGAQWWAYPRPAVGLLEGKPIDFAYISHGHHDHLHFGTLATLPKGFRFLVSSEIDIGPALRERGYEVIEVAPDRPYDLGSGVHCRIWPTDGGDTLMVISDGAEVLVNANDALHSAPQAVREESFRRLGQCYPTIDYLFCGYGTASHFPNCYVIPGKDREATARKRQLRFNRAWAEIVAALAPRHAFPFAADVVFLENDLFWVNEVLQNGERPVETFRKMYPQTAVDAIDIAPGFVIEHGTIAHDVRRKRIASSELAEEMREEIVRANAYGAVSMSIVDEILALLKTNLAFNQAHLTSYPEDYRFLIRFRALDRGIEVVKRGADVSIRDVAAGSEPEIGAYDIVFLSRAHYLRTSLTTKYGHEILFVGSGGIFEFARREDAARNLHRELITLMKNHEKPLPPRPASSLLTMVKRGLKSAIGKRSEDLYDLASWTVFHA